MIYKENLFIFVKIKSDKSQTYTTTVSRICLILSGLYTSWV